MVKFVPGPGHVLICDFNTGFKAPEMVKARPFVVISPKRRRAQLVTGVPLSSVPPEPAEPWHHPVAWETYPPARKPMWAKGDMVVSISLDRLDRVKVRDAEDRRRYRTFQATDADLDAIRAAVRSYLGLA